MIGEYTREQMLVVLDRATEALQDAAAANRLLPGDGTLTEKVQELLAQKVNLELDLAAAIAKLNRLNHPTRNEVKP